MVWAGVMDPCMFLNLTYFAGQDEKVFAGGRPVWKTEIAQSLQQ
jgi:hypothetical protein